MNWRHIYHLVCQDTVELVVIQADHPLQALELILLERTSNQDTRLLRDLLRCLVRNSVIINLTLVVGIVHFLRAKHRLVGRTVF